MANEPPDTCVTACLWAAVRLWSGNGSDRRVFSMASFQVTMGDAGYKVDPIEANELLIKRADVAMLKPGRAHFVILDKLEQACNEAVSDGL